MTRLHRGLVRALALEAQHRPPGPGLKRPPALQAILQVGRLVIGRTAGVTQDNARRKFPLPAATPAAL